MYTVPIVREFLTEFSEKHDVSDAVVVIRDVGDLKGGLHKEDRSYRIQLQGYSDLGECIFWEVDERTPLFSNRFSHVYPSTAKT